MNQIATDHLVASLLDDLDEKVHKLEAAEEPSSSLSKQTVNLGSPPSPQTSLPTTGIQTSDLSNYQMESNNTTGYESINIGLGDYSTESADKKNKLSNLISRLTHRSDTTLKIDTANNLPRPQAKEAMGQNGDEEAREERQEMCCSSINKTRLPNLPPKDPLEERKHLAQFQEMMVAAKQREALKAEEASQAKAAKETNTHKLTRLWQEDLLLNWGKPGWEKRVFKVIIQGIPPACRGHVWARCLQGPASGTRPSPITSDTYAFLLDRARRPPQPYQLMANRNYKLITLDAMEVFPELGLFGSGSEGGDLGIGGGAEAGPFHQPLMNILGAHAALAPTELYSNRAVGPLAGLLLLHLEEESAFLALQGLLERPLHAAFALATPQAPAYVAAFDLAFAATLPRLFKHFQTIQLKTEMFLGSWLGNLFTRHLSLDLCCLVWDCYLVGGTEEEAMLFNVALIILEWLEPHLYGRLDEALSYLGQPVALPIDQLQLRLNLPISRPPTPPPLPKLVSKITSSSTIHLNNHNEVGSIPALYLPKEALTAIKSLRLGMLGNS